MIAFHYSLEHIELGSVIRSNQRTLARYPQKYRKFHDPYVKEAAKLDFALPYTFGYAYKAPELRGKGALTEYVVEAEDSKVITGNRIYSLSAALSADLRHVADVERWAKHYFKASEHLEVISDTFVVVDMLHHVEFVEKSVVKIGMTG